MARSPGIGSISPQGAEVKPIGPKANSSHPSLVKLARLLGRIAAHELMAAAVPVGSASDSDHKPIRIRTNTYQSTTYDTPKNHPLV